MLVVKELLSLRKITRKTNLMGNFPLNPDTLSDNASSKIYLHAVRCPDPDCMKTDAILTDNPYSPTSYLVCTHKHKLQDYDENKITPKVRCPRCQGLLFRNLTCINCQCRAHYKDRYLYWELDTPPREAIVGPLIPVPITEEEIKNILLGDLEIND